MCRTSVAHQEVKALEVSVEARGNTTNQGMGYGSRRPALPTSSRHRARPPPLHLRSSPLMWELRNKLYDRLKQLWLPKKASYASHSGFATCGPKSLFEIFASAHAESDGLLHMNTVRTTKCYWSVTPGNPTKLPCWAGASGGRQPGCCAWPGSPRVVWDAHLS